MSGPSAECPVFISYSRRDYYFAESLALHLLKDGIPAWLDVKDLNPGVFWERDLFAALDKACCVVIIASADSMKSPNVRQEMERAISQKKRIIIARFRGAKLANELCQCEVVDFRGAFRPALHKLLERLKTEPAGTQAAANSRFVPPAPFTVLGLLCILFVPLFVDLLLADWSGGPSSPVAHFLLVALLALGACWLMSFSFLQRKMGMTRLAVSLAILSAVFAGPLIEYRRSGAQGLANEAARMSQAVSNHWGAMLLIAALPLAGLAVIVVLQPYDLLRWAPTGSAWRWYRRRCATRVLPTLKVVPAPSRRPFFLLHDSADAPAGEMIRERLTQAGWTLSTAPSGATSVLLLTNRTNTNWLLQQQPQLTPDVLTVVATTICLPIQMEWLWKREWVDLRNWKLDRLHKEEALPQVPEAVTTPHFPASVRLAHHLLCCLAGLAFSLMIFAAPAAFQSEGSSSLEQTVFACLGVAVIIACIETARRLLRRTLTQSIFYWISCGAWIGTLALAAGALGPSAPMPDWLRAGTAIVFLLVFPFGLLRMRKSLAFWFPSTWREPSKAAQTLTGKIYWRTFWCVAAYLLFWGWISGWATIGT
jgi:hypothetical protein